MRRRPSLIPLLIALATVIAACRSKAALELSDTREEYVSGCVSRDHSFLDLLDACTRDYGTKFVLLDGVERDLDRMNCTMISCFVPPGTKASELELSANIEMVQQMVLRCRDKEHLDLMIDREPLPGMNTYRIYRLPQDAPNPWDKEAAGR